MTFWSAQWPLVFVSLLTIGNGSIRFETDPFKNNCNLGPELNRTEPRTRLTEPQTIKPLKPRFCGSVLVFKLGQILKLQYFIILKIFLKNLL